MAPDIQSIVADATSHHRAGRLDEAVAAYRRLLALRPDQAGVHHNLANALFAQGKFAEAEAGYRRALALKPGLASAHNNLGTVLLERDRLDDAIACYRQALFLDPGYAEALNNLGTALCRQGELDEGEAQIRRALALKPDFAGAHDNLGTVLWEKGRLGEAETSIRRALQLRPDFVRARNNLGSVLTDQGRLNEAAAIYRDLLRIAPEDCDGLNGLASVLAAQGDAAGALETVLRSLGLRETQSAKRTFVDIAKGFPWAGDHVQARQAMTCALTEPWARPGALAHAAAALIKQGAHVGACVARAVEAWPHALPAAELFGPGGAKAMADDELLLALLVSAENCDVGLERFLTMARRALLGAGMRDETDDEPDNAELAFYAALACQCFINDYVFFHGEEEIDRARRLRDALAQALETGAAISPLRLLAVAAYFPLHAIPRAPLLLEMAGLEPVSAVLVQQVREPSEEEGLRTCIPRLTPIGDRRVQTQYEENPYPRWVRMPPAAAKANDVAGYLRRRFPLASFQPHEGGENIAFLSAGCGTGQFPLDIARSVGARVLAIDLSLASLGYAKRKACELGLTDIEFAQADLLALGEMGRRFDVVECSGVLHHLADPFAGWRVLLSLLRPGGFMLVGLYSEIARRGLVEAKAFIAERGYGPTAGDIRRCRQDLLALPRSRELGAGFGDFFGLSGCRDLLFHVQEQHMRLPVIAAFLKDNGLTFLGFETDAATLRDYRRRFPGDPAATNLEYWDIFENEHPDTFARMYVFWIQKS